MKLEVAQSRNDDSIHSFAQDLEVLIRALEIHMRSSMKTIQKLHHHELDLEATAREATMSMRMKSRILWKGSRTGRNILQHWRRRWIREKTFSRVEMMDLS